MKFIHCADLHLDSRMESNLSREKACERREELLSTFASIIDYAKENEVRAIIIAGDLFDTSKDSQKRIKTRVLDLIRYSEGIDFLYLRGNHDRVDYFDHPADKPANLKLFADTWTTYHYENVDITGCELHKDTPATIYGGLVLDTAHVNIVVLHGQESLYDQKGDAEIIRLSALQNHSIDYLALGHIHSYKCAPLDTRGIYCYCGCPEGRGFDECGEKGFVLLDINGGKVEHSFIPAARRTLHEVHVGLAGYMKEIAILGTVSDAIAHIPSKDLVKVILEGDIDEQTDIDLRYLMNQLEGKFYFLKIYNQTKLMLKQENYEKDISLKGEFIRLVQEQPLDEDEKRSIIMMGLKALSGREIDL